MLVKFSMLESCQYSSAPHCQKVHDRWHLSAIWLIVIMQFKLLYLRKWALPAAKPKKTLLSPENAWMR